MGQKVSKRNLYSANSYVDALFEKHARLLVLRVDLSYKKEHAKNTTINDAKADMRHLLNNRRGKPSIFSNCVGHIWKAEQTPDKGVHFHTAFFYDGSKVEKDAHLASKIGNYWKNSITEGRGIAFNCNAKSAQYEKPGIGKINHFDDEMRDNLRDEVLTYLTKTDQSIDKSTSGNERCFGKGIAPKRKSRAGRPRN